MRNNLILVVVGTSIISCTSPSDGYIEQGQPCLSGIVDTIDPDTANLRSLVKSNPKTLLIFEGLCCPDHTILSSQFICHPEINKTLRALHVVRMSVDNTRKAGWTGEMDIGGVNRQFQAAHFGSYSQPLYVLVDTSLHIIGIPLTYTRDTAEVLAFLRQ